MKSCIVLILFICCLYQCESQCSTNTLGEDYVYWMDYAGVFKSETVLPIRKNGSRSAFDSDYELYNNPTKNWFPLCRAWTYAKRGTKDSYQDFCIFPSTEMNMTDEEPGLWTHPYIGTDINKYTGDACSNSILYYYDSVLRPSGLGKKWCGYSMGLARCLFKHKYHPKANNVAVWSELPGVKNILYDSEYDYSAAHPNCYGFPCDSVIYIRFPDLMKHKELGGYYVIDGIEERKCGDYYVNDYANECKPLENKGFSIATDFSAGIPRYRHLNKPIWIQAELSITSGQAKEDVTLSTYARNDKSQDMVLRMITVNYKNNSEIVLAKTRLKPRWSRKGKLEEIIGKIGGDENSGQKAPRIESFTCLSQMNDLLEPWRPDNVGWNETNEKPIKIEIESRLDNGAPPIRGPCGASYRVSENYALSSGHQPFVVEIRVASKGLANKDNQVKCLGTIVTHRHILSVATCFCNRDMPEHNLDWSSVGGCESDGVKTKRLSMPPPNPNNTEEVEKANRKLNNVEILVGNQDPTGRIADVKTIGVLWIAIHKSFRLATREYNIAILGTLYPMQFHSFFYQICLPHPAYSDTNTDPIGGIKYSVRMLSAEGDTGRDTGTKYTNANGRTIFSKCNSTCFRTKLPWDKIYHNDTSGTDLCEKLEQAEESGTIKYRNDRFEPQAQKRIVFRGKNDFGVEEYKQVICYDRSLNSIRNRGQGSIGGWCTVAPPSDKLAEEKLWGFCNDANEIPSAECITGTTSHKYFEVETTLLPNEVCNIRSTTLTTKQCTGYVPHKPSIYDFTYDKETGFEFNGYLGGYYRDFVPKTNRRRSRIRYDFDGNAKYDTVRPKFHMGFPQKFKVCHRRKVKVSDMGAPTYWRLARLSTQMTINGGTRYTTQEPQDGGQSIVVLSSILSGYSDETGAKCNLVDGYYTDEEISLSAPGVMDWISEEINQLSGFDKLYNFEKFGKRKVVGQRVTTAKPYMAQFTTPITTAKGATESTTADTVDEKYLDVIQFVPEDYYDPSLIEELNRFEPDYPDPGPDFYPDCAGTNSWSKFILVPVILLIQVVY